MDRRIGVSAGLGSFAAGIILAIYEVQGWNMPVPLAISLIVLFLLMIVTAIGVIIYEIRKWAKRIWQQQVVSAAWVSNEEPGLLDYEADFQRANERFIRELNKLTKDTKRTGERLPKHQRRIQKAIQSKNPRIKQKSANQVAKDIGRNAIHISDRKKLFDSLNKEVYRNGKGIVSSVNLDDENAEEGSILQETLNNNIDVTKSAIQSVFTYIDALNNIIDINISRTIRIESKRLVESLNILVKTLRQYEKHNQDLKNMVGKKTSASR